MDYFVVKMNIIDFNGYFGGINSATNFRTWSWILEKFKYEKIRRQNYSLPCLLVIDPADIHVGKLASSFETGEDYNTQIAVQRVREGVDGILHKASGFNIEKIVFVAGNDILHIDTPKRTTTSGTPQDTDGMWYDNF